MNKFIIKSKGDEFWLLKNAKRWETYEFYTIEIQKLTYKQTKEYEKFNYRVKVLRDFPYRVEHFKYEFWIVTDEKRKEKKEQKDKSYSTIALWKKLNW